MDWSKEDIEMKKPRTRVAGLLVVVTTEKDLPAARGASFLLWLRCERIADDPKIDFVKYLLCKIKKNPLNKPYFSPY